MKHIALCSLLPLPFATVAGFDFSVNPQNLFDVGVNMGYLTRHAQKGTSAGICATWAGNAGAEWLASWDPGAVGTIAPAPPYPSGAITAHTFYIEAIQIKLSGFCQQPWLRTSLGAYRMGRTLAMAHVEAGSNCTDCLRSDMQSAAIDLENVGRILSNAGIAGGQTMTTMASNLRTAAAGLRSGLSAERAAEQKFSQAAGLLEMINTVNGILPDALQPCSAMSGFAGAFSTSYGTMTFSGANSSKIADYTSDSGRLLGSISGGSLNGFWVEKSSSRKCATMKDGSYYWGRFVATLNADGQGFSAKWSYCDDEPRRSWSGTRK